MRAKETIRYATGALGAILSLVVAGGVSAAPVRVDFGVTGDESEDWTGSFDDGINFADPALTTPGVATGALPFDMFIGSTTYSDYCVIEDGVVWFTNSADSCGATPSGAIFDVLGADWESSNSTIATDPGTVSASLGLVDREAPFDASGRTTETLRFLWNAVLLAGGDGFTEHYIQAAFFDVGGGDFDLEFSYGTATNPALYTGTQSIAEGGVPLFTGGPQVATSVDYVFSFRGGVLQPPTSVPEPSTWLLFSGALLGLAFSRRRAGLRTASPGAPA